MYNMIYRKPHLKGLESKNEHKEIESDIRNDKLKIHKKYVRPIKEIIVRIIMPRHKN
jgi:hypothetical protein